jgi:hypothetical protein
MIEPMRFDLRCVNPDLKQSKITQKFHKLHAGMISLWQEIPCSAQIFKFIR